MRRPTGPFSNCPIHPERRPDGLTAPVLAAILTQTAIAVGTYLVGKAVTKELPPLGVVAVRSLASGALMLGLLAMLPRPFLPPRRLLLPLVVYGFFAGPVNQGAFLYGLSQTSPAHASLLYALTPAGVYLLSVVLGREQAARRRMLGLAVAFTGVAVLLLGRGLAEASGTLTGDLWVLSAVGAWVTVTVQAKSVSAEMGALKTTAWMLVFAGVWMIPVAPFVVSPAAFASASTASLLGVAYLVVLSSVASYLLWTFALARTEASKVAVFTNLQPIGTALAAWALLGEPLTVTLLVGGALVLSGVRLAQR